MVFTTSFWMSSVIALLSITLNVRLFFLLRRKTDGHCRRERESESMLRSLVAQVPSFIIKIDRAGAILFINRTAAGFFKEKVVGSSVYSYLSQEECQRLKEITARVWETGATEVYEMCGPGAGGEPAYYETHIGPIWHDGRIVALILVSNDITARKEMVDALRESEQQFRMLAETVPAAVAIYQDGRHKYCNRALERIAGYSREEMLDQEVGALVHPDDHAMVVARSLARQRGEDVPDRYEFRIVTKQGEQRFVDFVGTQIVYQGRTAILGSALDVTQRRQAEETLQQSERRLQFQRDVLEEIANGRALPQILRTLCRFVERTVPRTICSVLFLDESEGRLRFGVGPSMTPEIVAAVDGMQIGEQAGSCGTAAYTKRPAIVSDTQVDPRWQAMRGLARKLHIRACWSVPILSDQQDVLGTFAISHSRPASPTPFQMEILETASHLAGIAIMRQQSAERQRRSEQRYRLLLEHASDAFFLYDARGRIVEVNEQACRSLGYSRRQMLTLPLHNIDPRWTPEELSRSARSMERGRTITLDSRHRRADGSTFPVELRMSIVDLDGDRLILMLARDVTQRKQVEERLRRQEAQLAHAARLATMGEMVAGIAHEISQPLSAIGNFSAASTSMLESGAEDRMARAIQFHRRINEQALRAGSIIERLRNFVRRGDPHRDRCKLCKLIAESVALLNSEARRFDATVHIGTVPDDLHVEVDAIQIQQVIVNLLRNAFEAMHELEASRRHVWVDARVVDEQVEITVTDNGPGIPRARRHQVFEPFYTSKQRGMGMGLAVSRSIIDAHGGRFWNDTAHAKGASFHFTLPRRAALTA